MDQLTENLVRKGVLRDKAIISAFEKNPRNLFVESKVWESDYPISIGFNQTISQPTTVALMTQWLEVKEDHLILEVGTGSGWQAAILSDLAKEVYTIERIPELYESAKMKLMSKKNVFVHLGDGSKGLKNKKFDRIIVTAAAKKLPKKLVESLKDKGIMIIPVGENYQKMFRIKKSGEKISEKDLGWFTFVPLIED